MIFDGRTRRRFVRDLFAFGLAGPQALRAFAKDGTLPIPVFPIRKRLPNPFVENGKPIVVVVKGTDFRAMLAKGMEMMGGFVRFGSNKSVIVKPNFVFDKKTRYPVTTDEASVLATVQLLQKEGFGEITVADRRGKRKNGRAGGKFDWSGLNAKADVGGFKTDSLMDDGLAEAVQIVDRRWSDMPVIGVIKTIYDAGLIINMPTVKRHSITNLTCSLKNNMGVLDVPSTENMHLWGDSNVKTREAMDPDAVTRRLCRTVAEAASAVSPDMTIIDARKVLCKNHVNYGTGEVREANQLIISGDPLAADIYATRLLKDVDNSYDIGFTTETFRVAEKLGLGEADQKSIVIKNIEA